jgi:hypothetical protein
MASARPFLSCSLEAVMVRSAGSPRTVIVKRRGSKRHVAEGDSWDNSRREAVDPVRDADDRYPDPVRTEHAPAGAQ